MSEKFEDKITVYRIFVACPLTKTEMKQKLTKTMLTKKTEKIFKLEIKNCIKKLIKSETRKMKFTT